MKRIESIFCPKCNMITYHDKRDSAYFCTRCNEVNAVLRYSTHANKKSLDPRGTRLVVEGLY